jgi:hypothetical protein
MRRFVAIVVFPFALAVVLPLALLFGVLFYISCMVRALIDVGAYLWRPKESAPATFGAKPPSEPRLRSTA